MHPDDSTEKEYPGGIFLRNTGMERPVWAKILSIRANILAAWPIKVLKRGYYCGKVQEKSNLNPQNPHFLIVFCYF